MYICLCLGVTTSTVQQAIDAGARSTKQVAAACGAGSVCGRCNHTIRTMIEGAAPDPAQPTHPPPLLRASPPSGHHALQFPTARRAFMTLAAVGHLDLDIVPD